MAYYLPPYIDDTIAVMVRVDFNSKLKSTRTITAIDFWLSGVCRHRSYQTYLAEQQSLIITLMVTTMINTGYYCSQLFFDDVSQPRSQQFSHSHVTILLAMKNWRQNCTIVQNCMNRMLFGSTHTFKSIIVVDNQHIKTNIFHSTVLVRYLI